MTILDRFRLDKRVALVTAGAGPLFGTSISEALAEAGATVITASRSLERNEQFAAKLISRGYDAHALQVDISNPDSIDRLAKDVEARFERLDILVNSAVARAGHVGSFTEQTCENLQEAAAGDFVGLFRMCQRFIPGMLDREKGSIINIASIYGVVSNDFPIYAGTQMKQPPSYNFVKAGMINFTRYLASLYSRGGVRSNCISPGGYLDDQPRSFVDEYEHQVPIGRMLSHTDLQGAVVFLASDASEYITGVNLMVDGGWTCR